MTPDYKISPVHRRSGFGPVYTLDQKIEIFAARIKGWFIDVADRLQASDPNAGLAVLQICFGYFETIAKYEDGYVGTDYGGKSRHYFKRGVRSVFPVIDKAGEVAADNLLEILYCEIRNGLYHSATFGHSLLLTHEVPGFLELYQHLEMEDTYLVKVNPHVLPGNLREHLSEYVAQVSETRNDKLRWKFEARFDHDANLKWVRRKEPRPGVSPSSVST